MSRTIDPAAQHRSGRGFAPITGLPATGLPSWLQDAITDGSDPTGEGGWSWKAEAKVPDGATPVVLRSGVRGVLHRGYRALDGSLHGHPRCHATPPSETLPKGAEFWYDNLRDTDRLCRYPWCFRAVVAELGIIPVVGHYSRRLRKRAAA